MSTQMGKQAADMTELDERIAIYLKAIEVEGKTPKTIASYANSLQAFRRVGTRLGLPGRIAEYEVAHVYEFLSELRARGASPDYQHRMLLAVTPDSFIPEEHPIRRIKPIVESAAADRARLGGARLEVCSAHPGPQHAPDLRGSHDECGWKSGRSGGKASERRAKERASRNLTRTGLLMEVRCSATVRTP